MIAFAIVAAVVGVVLVTALCRFFYIRGYQDAMTYARGELKRIQEEQR